MTVEDASHNSGAICRLTIGSRGRFSISYVSQRQNIPTMDDAPPASRQTVSTGLFEALDQLTMASRITLAVEIK